MVARLMRKLKHDNGRADDVVIRDADVKVERVTTAAAEAERRLRLVEARARVYSRNAPS